MGAKMEILAEVEVGDVVLLKNSGGLTDGPYAIVAGPKLTRPGMEPSDLPRYWCAHVFPGPGGFKLNLYDANGVNRCSLDGFTTIAKAEERAFQIAWVACDPEEFKARQVRRDELRRRCAEPAGNFDRWCTCTEHRSPLGVFRGLIPDPHCQIHGRPDR